MSIFRTSRLGLFLVMSLGVFEVAYSIDPEPGILPALETILVTASRLDIGSSTEQSILDRKDIERLSATSTSSLLRASPHLFLFENGGGGGLNFASVRGGDPNFMLVLIDGIIVNDPTSSRGGGFDFNQIDPRAIESIEVYRGGVSALYGGEALSGAIHIKTRNGGGGELGVTVGNAGQRQLGGVLRSSNDSGLSTLLMASHTALERSPQQRFKNQQALFKARVDSKRASNSLLVSISDQNARAFPEDSAGALSSLGLAEVRDSQQLILGGRSRLRLNPNLSLNFQLSHAEHKERAISPGIASGVLDGIPPTDIRSEFAQTTVDSNLAFEGWAGAQVLLGASYRDSEGENDGVVDFGFPLPVDYALQQRTFSTYAELLTSGPRWSASIGARHDNPDGFSGELSSRLRVNYTLSRNFVLEADYSEGFKLPSFFALANPLVGNPSLQPEYSTLRSVSARLDSDSSLGAGLSYFDNDYRNLVDFDAASFTNINRSSVNASGLEVDLRWQSDASFELTAALTYLDARPGDGDAPLRRRPKWLAQLQANAPFGPGSGFLALRYRSSFLDSSQLTGPTILDGYYSLDAGWQWRATRSATLAVNVDNLLDETLEDAVGFTDTGRLLRVGLRYQFPAGERR